MIAVIVYHKNIFSLYDREWIDMFKYSIVYQTRKDFVIYELNYGGGEERIFENSVFQSIEMPTFVNAMNYLLDQAFELGATCAFNTNTDDFFSLNRIERQMRCIELGYDLVSSNFSLVRDGKITHTHEFHLLDIKEQIEKWHNIIGHPVVAYSKSFWEKNGPYDPDQVPLEDLKMWQKGIENSEFIILPDVLLYHRLHDQSVCKSQNR